MPSDLKADLLRLVDRLERAYQVAEDGDHPDRLQWYDDWRAASWALQRLEELESRCESLTRQNDDLLTKSAEWAKEVKRLRDSLAGAVTNFRCSEHADAKPACCKCYEELETDSSRWEEAAKRYMKKVVELEAENQRLRKKIACDGLNHEEEVDGTWS